MLTSSTFPSGMNKTLDQMRDRELMTFKMDDVRKWSPSRATTEAKSKSIAMATIWKIVKPANFAADQPGAPTPYHAWRLKSCGFHYRCAD